ncbi:hypothetical protein ACFFLM_02495 [Deinococcus oregonensis]|uniref:YubB ferredoxin-like domain-containing protein n=1 Tax=Deinococcus oregonensis TaxID=1805970 RepID=A0ABV6ATM7_9DEIO
MTNWCTNRLTVQGEHAELQRFLAAQAGSPATYDPGARRSRVALTFNAQVPVPPEVLEIGYHSGSPEQEAWQLLHSDDLYPRAKMDENHPSGMRNNEDGLAARDGNQSQVVPAVGPVSGFVCQVLHWGTARDLESNEVRVALSGNQLHLDFSTVWSPPTAWVRTVAAQWPNLHFDLAYIEPGGGFAGQLTVQGLQIITDESHDVNRGDLERWGLDPDE